MEILILCWRWELRVDRQDILNISLLVRLYCITLWWELWWYSDLYYILSCFLEGMQDCTVHTMIWAILQHISMSSHWDFFFFSSVYGALTNAVCAIDRWYSGKFSLPLSSVSTLETLGSKIYGKRRPTPQDLLLIEDPSKNCSPGNCPQLLELPCQRNATQLSHSLSNFIFMGHVLLSIPEKTNLCTQYSLPLFDFALSILLFFDHIISCRGRGRMCAWLLGYINIF